MFAFWQKISKFDTRPTELSKQKNHPDFVFLLFFQAKTCFLQNPLQRNSFAKLKICNFCVFFYKKTLFLRIPVWFLATPRPPCGVKIQDYFTNFWKLFCFPVPFLGARPSILTKINFCNPRLPCFCVPPCTMYEKNSDIFSEIRKKSWLRCMTLRSTP